MAPEPPHTAPTPRNLPHAPHFVYFYLRAHGVGWFDPLRRGDHGARGVAGGYSRGLMGGVGMGMRTLGIALVVCGATVARAQVQGKPATVAGTPVGGLAAGGAESGALQVLTQMGIEASPRGLEAAISSGDPPKVIAALNAAAALRMDLLANRAMDLLRAPNFAVQLAAGKYLGEIGVQQGADLVRGFAEAPREQLLMRKEIQFLALDAAREVARHGRVDYAYQLPFLLEQGDWDVKDFAAQILGDFQQADDPTVRYAWTTALSLYKEAITNEDIGLRSDAAPYAEHLLESAGKLTAVSTEVLEKFEELAGAPVPALNPGVTAPDFGGALARLRTLPVRDPAMNCPPLDPDPRVACQSAAERMLLFLDKGQFDTFPQDLDEKGRFEGMGKAEWIARSKAAWVPSTDFVNKRINTRTVRSSQPSSYEVHIEIAGDEYDTAQGKWSAMIYRFRCLWWGFNWHFNVFDRVRDPVQPIDVESIPSPAVNPEFPGPQGVASALAEAFEAAKPDLLEPICAGDGTFGSDKRTREEFIAQIRAQFATAGEKYAFRPSSYSFESTDDPAVVRGVVEMYSVNKSLFRIARVEYRLDIAQREGGWIITNLTTEFTKIH